VASIKTDFKYFIFGFNATERKKSQIMMLLKNGWSKKVFKRSGRDVRDCGQSHTYWWVEGI